MKENCCWGNIGCSECKSERKKQEKKAFDILNKVVAK